MRPRQGIDLSLKLGVADGKNKRTGTANKAAARGAARFDDATPN
jgi:hypothetical protein